MADKVMVNAGTRLCVSSSVLNFKEKLERKTGYEGWKPFYRGMMVFVGMYHIGDYLRYVLHFGPRKVFWCGSDILQLSWAKKIFEIIPSEHFCENEQEEKLLFKNGISAKIRPSFFDDASLFPVSFTKGTNVYLCAHEGRESEYGVNIILDIAKELREITFHVYGIHGHSTKNVVFHGKVSDKKFNKDIRKYQCGLRLNEFDGFGEVTAKSVLLGQYPITRIRYPYIDHAKDITTLIALLKNIQYKTKPNMEARNYWFDKLNSFI